MPLPTDKMYPRHSKTLSSKHSIHCRSSFMISVIFWVATLSFAPSAASAQSGPDTNETFRQASAALREGRLDEAASGFEAVTRAAPTFAGAHFNLGLVREEQGKFEEAVTSLKKALTLNPRLPGANLFLGIAHYRLNQYEPALTALRLEIKQNPADPKAWMWLGVTQLAMEQPEDAAASLDRAAKLSPNDVDTLYHRGHAHLLVSKLSYERMLHADPNSWRIHQVLAQADAEAGRDMDAIAEYQAAIKAAPQQPGLHEELGTEYWKMSKMEEAAAEYQRELAIDPHSMLATYKLGSLQVMTAKAAEGKPLIESALRQDPNLKEAYYYLGRAEMQLGNDSAAVDAFKKCIAVISDPDIIEQTWYQLAMVYRRMHRTEDSRKALATFQKLKDEAAEHQQLSLEKKRAAQGLESAPPPDPPKDPNEH
jgi:tetratricopeptide (TPR) repeat protein